MIFIIHQKFSLQKQNQTHYGARNLVTILFCKRVQISLCPFLVTRCTKESRSLCVPSWWPVVQRSPDLSVSLILVSAFLLNRDKNMIHVQIAIIDCLIQVIFLFTDNFVKIWMFDMIRYHTSSLSVVVAMCLNLWNQFNMLMLTLQLIESILDFIVRQKTVGIELVPIHQRLFFISLQNQNEQATTCFACATYGGNGHWVIWSQLYMVLTIWHIYIEVSQAHLRSDVSSSAEIRIVKGHSRCPENTILEVELV